MGTHREGTHKNVRDPQYVGPGTHKCGSRGSWEVSGRSGPSNWCSINVTEPEDQIGHLSCVVGRRSSVSAVCPDTHAEMLSWEVAGGVIRKCCLGKLLAVYLTVASWRVMGSVCLCLSQWRAFHGVCLVTQLRDWSTERRRSS